jgi:peptidoglycan/LPS O-acetylase OafA/YrhL
MRKRYIEFDGLRGWLALWVALAHILCWCGYGRLPSEGKIGIIWSGFTAADAAVETFIILSGFAIHTLLMREPQSYGRYMTGRFFRIYPVYAVCLLVSLALLPAVAHLVATLPWKDDYYLGWMGLISENQSARPMAHTLWHATLLHGTLPKSVLTYSTTTLLKPAWSISLEWQFYLAAPLIAFLLRRAAGVVVLIAAGLLGQFTRGLWENPDNAFLLRWLPMFLIGIVCAEFAAWCERREDVPRRHGLPIVGIGIGLSLFLINKPVSFGIWTVGFTVALGAWDGFLPAAGKWLGALLRMRVAQWLGALSYPLYLLHWPFIVAMISFLHGWDPGMGQRGVLMILLAIGMPLLLVIAWGVHLWIEKPFMRLGKRLSGRVPPAVAAPVFP